MFSVYLPMCCLGILWSSMTTDFSVGAILVRLWRAWFRTGDLRYSSVRSRSFNSSSLIDDSNPSTNLQPTTIVRKISTKSVSLLKLLLMLPRFLFRKADRCAMWHWRILCVMNDRPKHCVIKRQVFLHLLINFCKFYYYIIIILQCDTEEYYYYYRFSCTKQP